MAAWIWDDVPEPVDFFGLVIRPMQHDGDSEKWIARSRKKPHMTEPLPRFIIKRGRDAVNERVSSWLAERYDVAHQVVRWSIQPEYPEVAIRFESLAYRPDKIDAESGMARTKGQETPILNSMDYYRHVALAAFLEETDGEEFMMLDGMLFRIDAAATCYEAHILMIERMLGVEIRPKERLTKPSFFYIAEYLRESDLTGYQQFVQVLQTLVSDDSLAIDVAHVFRSAQFHEASTLKEIFQDYFEERQTLAMRYLKEMS